MLPKRKIIKKSHRRVEQAQNLSCPQPGSLLERLRSPQQHHTEEALAYISSMCYLSENSESIVLLAELVAILIRGPTSFIYQCLYALANLVQVEPSIVSKLFQLGLQKALTQLNSNDSQLLKPILCLMGSLHGVIPSQFLYLEKGVEQSLTPMHLSTSKEQVLRYFNRIESSQLRQDVYEKVYQFFKSQEKLALRSLSASILLKNKVVRQKIAQDFIEYCQEILCDIDFQKQYTTNLVHAKPAEKPKEAETDMIDQEQEILINEHPNVQMFNDALQAAETLLEGLLLLFQEGVEEFEEQECEGEQWDNEIEVSNTQGGIQLSLLNFFNAKCQTIAKNTFLTFPESQNIVHLNLRLLGCCKIPNKQALSIIICRCFQNVLQVLKPELEIQQEILLVGLHMLLKCPVSFQGREMLLYLGQSVLQLSQGYKDAWLRLLELYSIHFNPEKCAVSAVENRRVGAILTNLIINIPEVRLQEWRGQAIDTVFDVFSNEEFDGYLWQLGLLGALEKVAGQVGKKTKFVREVVTDIQRFLEYKRKMMKF